MDRYWVKKNSPFGEFISLRNMVQILDLFLPELTFYDRILGRGLGLLKIAIEAVLIDNLIRDQCHKYLQEERDYHSIVNRSGYEVRIEQI